MCGWVGVCSGLAVDQSVVCVLIRDVVAWHRGKAPLDKWASSGGLSPSLSVLVGLYQLDTTWIGGNSSPRNVFIGLACRHVCVAFS